MAPLFFLHCSKGTKRNLSFYHY